MRRISSAGSVRIISLNAEEILSRARNSAEDLRRRFPEVKEVLVIGSLARGDFHGLSDLDLVLVVEGKLSASPLDRLHRYWPFLRERLDFPLDLLVFSVEEWEKAPEAIKREARPLL